MMYELYVENIALLRRVTLRLSPGMNALTGETGAGKSLVVDAVSLLIGGRGSDGFIRSGEDRALVEGVFLPPFPEAFRQALGDQADPEDNIILSRELIRGGRSLARLNGRSISLSRLRELGRLLVNIHGQHEHTLLLEDERQLAVVDGYGGEPVAEAVRTVSRAYQAMRQAEAAWREHNERREARRQRMEELDAVIDEITQADPRPGEDESLKEESRLLAHGERLYAQSDQVHEILSRGGGAVESLNEAASLLRQTAAIDGSLDALSQRLSSLFYEVEDAANEVASYRDQVNTDAWRLEEIESRIAALGRLSKKYGGNTDAVLETLAAAQKERQELEEEDFSGERLEKEQGLRRREYAKAASDLRQIRQRSAAELGRAVTRELRRLAMEKAVFSVELAPHEAKSSGTEGVVFMIRPNPGEPAQPVARIASGGELSRIVLGLKVILSQLDFVPTLVFDEIDTGMGGSALISVAERLRLVSRSAQTVAVSHNPIMAAAAHSHIVIEKHEEDGRTVAVCHQLEQEERPGELARMIAGHRAGETAVAQAREMLARFEEEEKK